MYAEPDATLHVHDPAYIAGLIAQSGLSQEKCGKRIGVSGRTVRGWLAGKPCPYPAQYALERLALAGQN